MWFREAVDRNCSHFLFWGVSVFQVCHSCRVFSLILVNLVGMKTHVDIRREKQ